MRKLFSPVLGYFESGNGEYAYRESHRKILVALGGLFLLLSFGSLYASIVAAKPAGALPVTIFFLVGSVCEIVGLLGSNRAVAKIWKSK
ncbi:hypothetical protein [Porticoccus sp.]